MVPLWRNFGNREYHIKKKSVSLQRGGIKLQTLEQKNLIIRDAVASYWMIIKLKKDYKIAQSSLDRFKSLHKLNLIKRKSGIISLAELLTSEVEITNRKKNLSVITSKLKVEKLRLQSILELKELPEIINSKMKISTYFEEISNAEIKQIINLGLINLKMNNNTKSFNGLLDIEEEASKSNLDLFISLKSFGQGDSLNDAIEENTLNKYEVYAGVNWDFDLGGKKKTSLINKALSQKRQSSLRQLQIELKLNNGFIEAREKITSNTEQILFFKNIIVKQKKILKTEKKRFKNGKISTLDYVKLQEAYDKSLLNIIGLEFSSEIIALFVFDKVGSLDRYIDKY